MGEQTILVCDVCGKPAAQTVTIRVGNRNFVKDFCSTHLSELTAGARAPRRGRRKATVAAAAPSGAKRRGRPPKSKAAKKTASRKKSGSRRRGRPRKKSASA